ncbi:4Fe-4S dicluster domain-containing protein [Anoxynatronum sibiricum]|uniref:4Fe-4S dicluster domain-containing protein n=2 Tax=Anoxynatronum sibiricum TaxID=210623 RepID=A0ABU9VSC5_9CLOT
MMVMLTLVGDQETMTLNMSHCASCIIKGKMDAESIFHQHHQQVQKLLATWIPVKKLVIAEDVLPAVSATSESMSRRGFFDQLTKQVKETAVSTGQELLQEADTQTYPMRDHLLIHVNKQVITENREMFLDGIMASLTADNRCTACGQCKTTCLQGAWQIEASKDRLILSHHATRCNDCGRCREVCPSGVISKLPLTAASLSGPMVCQTWVYGHCTRCRRKLLSDKLKMGHCHACHKQIRLKRQLFENESNGSCRDGLTTPSKSKKEELSYGSD